MRIAVAGATGIVGTWIVREAQAAGHDVVPVSRAQGADLVTGAGLHLDGVDAIIDASGPRTGSAKQARAFFAASTANLLRAGAESGVPHLVSLGIVGAAKAPYGYYAGKALQEQLVTAGPIPWTLLRSTQFFEFAQKHVQRIGPWWALPVMRSQPVAAASVARRLVELAAEAPQSRVLELAGPEQLSLAHVLRARDHALGVRRRVIELRLPGGFARALRDGTILPGADAEIVGPHCAEWASAPA